jgi:hypothetical protein
MVSEKMSAMAEAKSIFVRGGDPSLVIENYQKIVAANVARLSGSQNYWSPCGALTYQFARAVVWKRTCINSRPREL